MGRTIEDSVKYLTAMKKTYIADTEMVSIAIDTMHKYQKIEKIIEDWESDKGWALEMSELYWLDRVKEVIEDGNDR